MTQEQRLMLAKLRKIVEAEILKTAENVAFGLKKQDTGYIGAWGANLAILYTLRALIDGSRHDETSEDRPDLVPSIREIIAGKNLTVELSLRTQRLMRETLPPEAES